MHGNTADTLFMFDSGAEGVRVFVCVWDWKRLCDCVFVCVYKGERNRVKEAEGVNKDLGNLPKSCLSHSEFAKWISNLKWVLGGAEKSTCCAFQLRAISIQR